MSSEYGRLVRVEDNTPQALYVKRIYVSAKERAQEQVEAVRKLWESLASIDHLNICWFREDDIYIGCLRPR